MSGRFWALLPERQESNTASASHHGRFQERIAGRTGARRRSQTYPGCNARRESRVKMSIWLWKGHDRIVDEGARACGPCLSRTDCLSGGVAMADQKPEGNLGGLDRCARASMSGWPGARIDACVSRVSVFVGCRASSVREGAVGCRGGWTELESNVMGLPPTEGARQEDV